jgi:hypothetical protein
MAFQVLAGVCLQLSLVTNEGRNLRQQYFFSFLFPLGSGFLHIEVVLGKERGCSVGDKRF